MHPTTAVIDRMWLQYSTVMNRRSDPRQKTQMWNHSWHVNSKSVLSETVDIESSPTMAPKECRITKWFNAFLLCTTVDRLNENDMMKYPQYMRIDAVLPRRWVLSENRS